ncbi:hypothetical protein K239x_15950 [Planctomycetes bacterium K23_9]|uniref:Uncharacterized protein n=1 Tax=Stieleria marina TaxID=1930275 RepID=A0A517NR86_9BACT|nr:hypothetical protein K239x_15950 [Planctomycetes bacterium K23_9]
MIRFVLGFDVCWPNAGLLICVCPVTGGIGDFRPFAQVSTFVVVLRPSPGLVSKRAYERPVPLENGLYCLPCFNTCNDVMLLEKRTGADHDQNHESTDTPRPV